MGFFDEAVGNFSSSVSNFIAAPAKTISQTIDNAVKNPIFNIALPAPTLIAGFIDRATGVSPTTQFGIGASVGAGVALFGGGPPPSQQAGMLAEQEAGLTTGAGTTFIPPALSAGPALSSGLREIKQIFNTISPPTAPATPAVHAPAAQQPSATALLIIGAVATAFATKVLF